MFVLVFLGSSVLAVDEVIVPIQTVDLALHLIDPFESLDMFPISNDLLPSNEVFLEYLRILNF